MSNYKNNHATNDVKFHLIFKEKRLSSCEKAKVLVKAIHKTSSEQDLELTVVLMSI